MDRLLISVPVLCDANYTVIFDKGTVQVIKDIKIIIKGPRDTETNLWLMPLKINNNSKAKPRKQAFIIQLKHTANNAYQQKLAAHLQAWRHATLSAPVVTRLIRVINND